MGAGQRNRWDGEQCPGEERQRDRAEIRRCRCEGSDGAKEETPEGRNHSHLVALGRITEGWVENLGPEKPQLSEVTKRCLRKPLEGRIGLAY